MVGMENTLLAKMQETAQGLNDKIAMATDAKEAHAWAESLQALMTAIGIATNLQAKQPTA